MPSKETWQLIWLAFHVSLYLLGLSILVVTETYWFIAIVTPIFIVILSVQIRDILVNDKKKARIESQRKSGGGAYYDNIWYRPADSTRIQHLTAKIKEAKKKIRRK